LSYFSATIGLIKLGHGNPSWNVARWGWCRGGSFHRRETSASRQSSVRFVWRLAVGWWACGLEGTSSGVYYSLVCTNIASSVILYQYIDDFVKLQCGCITWDIRHYNVIAVVVRAVLPSVSEERRKSGGAKI